MRHRAAPGARGTSSGTRPAAPQRGRRAARADARPESSLYRDVRCMVVRSRAAAALFVAASPGWMPTAPAVHRRSMRAVCSSSPCAGPGVCLILSTSADAASVSLQQALLAQTRWEPLASPSPGTQAWACGGARLWALNDNFLRMDGIDDRWLACTGQPATELIFLSRHASPTSGACLTVHPIGVPAHASEQDVLRGGGIPGRLAPPGVRLASLYRRLCAARKSGRLCDVAFPPNFRVSLEATHHGPAVETPSIFYEIGSSEQEWSCAAAAHLMAAALCTELEDVLTLVAAPDMSAEAAPGLLNESAPSAMGETAAGCGNSSSVEGGASGSGRGKGAAGGGSGEGGGGNTPPPSREAAGAAPMLSSGQVSSGPVLIGVGGGHYAPGMGDLARKPGVRVGHILARYAIQFAPIAESLGGASAAGADGGPASISVRADGSSPAEPVREDALVPTEEEAARSLHEGGGAATVLAAIHATRRAFGSEVELEIELDKRSFEPWQREAVAQLVCRQQGCKVRGRR